MNYAYIDGDNIGLLIEKCFMENNEDELKRINLYVTSTVDKITKYLIGQNAEIIFSGADGIICKGKNIQARKILTEIRKISKEITFSIGVGMSLKDAYIALRYAKSNNKDIAVSLFKNQFEKIK